MLKIIETDSYYNSFNLLADDIFKKSRNIDDNIFIFCEDKISLLAERTICDRLNGTFNIVVNSFSSYLLKNKNFDNLLSKEGSSMIIKNILSNVNLNLFHCEKNNLAPSLYELIIQLKSSRISPQDIKNNIELSKGFLKSKLEDIYNIYNAYENYISQNGYEDQNSVLKYLPSIIQKDINLAGKEVYFFNYSSLTSQMKEIAEQIIKVAKNSTAILTCGENKFFYVNENIKTFEDISKKLNIKSEISIFNTNFLKEQKYIADNLFTFNFNKEKITTDKIYCSCYSNSYQEIQSVAEKIYNLVQNGYKYKDIKIALPNEFNYREEIKKYFTLLNIPYFLDDKKRADNTPLIRLIFAYVNAFIKNLEVSALSDFYKNPLICDNKNFSDRFENYIYKYNINYSKFLSPLIYETEIKNEKNEFEHFREKISLCFKSFDIENMLNIFNVKEKIEELCKELLENNEAEESSTLSQVFKYTDNLLKEIKRITSGTNLIPLEFKSIFKSGIEALQISIIPQFNDAVFVGDYKETALTDTKFLFAVGLCNNVPNIKEDIAIISDDEIDSLHSLKLLLEPKIQIINRRNKEKIGLALSSFSTNLFLSYPLTNASGKQNIKSEIFDFFNNNFTIKKIEDIYGYCTIDEGMKTFAKDCGKYSSLLINDFTTQSSFYYVSGKTRADKILNYSLSEMKVNLENNYSVLVNGLSSATSIESYESCPFKYFIRKGLLVTDREKGEVNSLSVGIIMHLIFCEFIKKIDSFKNTEDASNQFDLISQNILDNEKYKYFLSDKIQNNNIKNLLFECKKNCLYSYNWLLNSKFKSGPENVEVRFGQNGKYPAISLDGGKYSLSGSIDRIDCFENYCRIIDYKTGSAEDDDYLLYQGKKIQLFLYASAVNDKKIAGLYYFKVKDEYSTIDKTQNSLAIGKTLDNKEIIELQDLNFNKEGKSKYIPVSLVKNKYKNVTEQVSLESMIEYSKLVSEIALKNMESGFIAPFSSEKNCTYCEFSNICGENKKFNKCRTIKDDEFIDLNKKIDIIENNNKEIISKNEEVKDGQSN